MPLIKNSSRSLLRNHLLYLIILLAWFLVACTPQPVQQTAISNTGQPIPEASPFVVVIGTPLVKSDPPDAQTDPLALPAYELITIPMPDGSSLQMRNYNCPRAEASTQVPIYSYRVVNRYPHDPLAYTQGLIFRDGVLYESTGMHGASSLRKVSLEDGQILQSTDLPPQYFGEGITELGGRIYQLTWKENTGFIYDFESFEPLGSFTYPMRGWGLTDDDQRLLMSDGTDKIYFLNPETLQFTGSLLVYDEFGPLSQINELEYVQGEIWANIFQSSCIARIDPQSGQVTGWVDLKGILALGELPAANVPNGIAFDPARQRIFITGKLWPQVFEIELVQQ